MTGQTTTLIIVSVALLVIDYYIFTGLKSALKGRFFQSKRFSQIYWGTSVLLIAGVFISIFFKLGVGTRSAILLVFFLLFVAKILLLPFLFIDDLRRLVIWLKRQFNTKPTVQTSATKPDVIPRSEFLIKAGLLAGALPIASLGYGTIKGVYDYHVRRVTLYLPNLPKKFDGLLLGQISDIHAGSFHHSKQPKIGVEMLMREKPDLIFFTGDLVNDRAYEMNGYQDLFTKVKAPLGVFSSFGNHDYGDYSYDWAPGEKEKNHRGLIAVHKNMGWNLLRNENRRIKVDGEEIGILGCENWGLLSRFKKYGNMAQTVKNTDDVPVKLLLSHDPSHWQAQVVPHYKQIDATFAGHTHGMQFGVRTKDFEWSPIEYVYKEWAGLYRENQQHLYVNVGYGFLGYPGRLGILPEITIFTLKSGTDKSVGT